MFLRRGPHYSKISIHAPREGGDGANQVVRQLTKISIHAPREGGDENIIGSTSLQFISIHAPREGGDPRPFVLKSVEADFNPRPPRGGRHPSFLG